MTQSSPRDLQTASISAATMPTVTVQRPLPKRRRTAKQMVLLSGTFAIGFAGLAIWLSWAIDPLQHYHKAWFNPVFSTEERYQNAGLARNYDYDTIILGTSMTENFLPSVVGKELGGQVMKLSLRGSLMPEQYETAKLALSTGKVKQVLWGIDYFALRQPDEEGEAFPSYLYDDNWWNDYSYWFSITPYEQLVEGWTKKAMRHGDQSLEKLDNWNNAVKFSSKLVMNDYRNAQQSEYYFGANEDPLSSVQQTFNTYVLALVQAHPEVKFTFYYPPYSILRQAVWQQTNPVRYENQLIMRKWMFEQLQTFANTRLYDFQAESRWTFDLDRYKDLSHHTEALNTAIAEAIGRDDAAYRVTSDNVDTLNAMLKEQVDSLVIDEKNNTVAAYPITIDGSEVSFSNRVSAGEGEVLVPAKEAAAAIGATMAWDAGSKSVSMRRGSIRMTLSTGKAVAVVNGTQMEASSPAQLVDNKLNIPLIFVAECLGMHVEKTVKGPAVTAFSIE
ncbi:copper amine oxidase-like protein [Paenibacillus cellulosilyticus]|uniref:Copper amine oxidase-like protein n=1 Tax=Paenibacillus cellulosilyticus TaxID=375489 RepID=A0A2V2YQZ1_9BACL|nr:copper amine oxidase N-terminal domain-containing protein [Paenibacillus cellulosilyticus]PWV99660.1 copper amine oxidase-like protein [Paenibacillus cellulosilyticus]QKS44902.1 copper amine oxidase N-terminal domain-containing protein [Paenibacillus cellulosilyticus]